MALGATHFRWRSDVLEVVRLIKGRWPSVFVNTYTDHPWPGWDGQSLDVWGGGGRGAPLPIHVGNAIVQTLFELPGDPMIRHFIWRHTLWTSWGGFSRWHANDHAGAERHVHVTYW